MKDFNSVFTLRRAAGPDRHAFQTVRNAIQSAVQTGENARLLIKFTLKENHSM